MVFVFPRFRKLEDSPLTLHEMTSLEHSLGTQARELCNSVGVNSFKAEEGGRQTRQQQQRAVCSGPFEGFVRRWRESDSTTAWKACGSVTISTSLKSIKLGDLFALLSLCVIR